MSSATFSITRPSFAAPITLPSPGTYPCARTILEKKDEGDDHEISEDDHAIIWYCIAIESWPHITDHQCDSFLFRNCSTVRLSRIAGGYSGCFVYSAMSED